MDQGTDARDILENRLLPLRRGYIGKLEFIFVLGVSLYVCLYWSIGCFVDLYWSIGCFIDLYWSIGCFIDLYWSIGCLIDRHWSIGCSIWSPLVYWSFPL